MIDYYVIDSNQVFVEKISVSEYAAMPSGTTTAPPATEGAQVARWLGQWEVLDEYPTPPEPPLLPRQEAAWERIKVERDRRKVLGVKVGDHWYHSDDSSRIQQLSLFVMGAAVPAVQWKTLTLTPTPVFVTMTQAIAAGIFQGTAASDAAIFGAAETHRLAMEASGKPENYDCASGWPPSIEDNK